MCGIICEICYSEDSVIKWDTKTLQRIRNRGPNHVGCNEIKVDDEVTMFFYGAVLWMQGLRPVAQPVENDRGILLYNGDIFDETWNNEISDTWLIMNKLGSVTNASSEELIKKIKGFKGPFSLIYYSKKSQELYFVRDKYGRNSLLLHKKAYSTVISSVLGRDYYNCVEIPAKYIYKLNVKSQKVSLISWSKEFAVIDEMDIELWIRNVQKQQSLPDDEFLFDYNDDPELNEEEPVVKYIECVTKETKCKLTVMKRLLEDTVISQTVLKITELLEKSVKIRLNRQPNKCKECLHADCSNCSHCTVAVLFSGGLDCTILAFLANKYLPKEQSIDLINVAFKNENSLSYDTPDRNTGRQSLSELRNVCPSRKWTFKEVNVPRNELIHSQKTTIADLVYPRQTILDESLGSALWFAAKCNDDYNTSSSRVILLGSGADELFGGYTRHRNAFKHKGWTGLRKELLFDWNRISFRNLARDNRVICDHGRQPRLPYLDEEFTEYVLALKPWLKCFPSENLESGIGDKLMLRLVAYNLGLTQAATLPKRALQFGSRIANKKEKGSDISVTFLRK